MNSNCCQAIDIRTINNQKEYVITSHKLLEAVLTDKNLNSQSAHLWQILYARSKYNTNLDIKISYSYLATLLSKSKRTIFRYVNTLVNNGYLIINNNYGSNNRQDVNTFSVRFPADKIEIIKNTTDRATSQKSIKDETPTKILPFYRKEVLNRATTNITKNNLIPITTDVAIPQKNSKKCDNIVTGEDDTDGTHKDISNKIINIKNNNSVVVHLDITNEKLEKLKYEKELAQQDFISETDPKKKLEKLNKFGELEARCFNLISRIAQIKANNQLNNKDNGLKNKIQDDKEFILNKKGDRVMDTYTFTRLIKNLSILGYKNTELNRMANEVVFEIRFGSLQKSKNGQDLPINHAVSIALKLVRDKVWTTPTYLNSYLGITVKKMTHVST